MNNKFWNYAVLMICKICNNIPNTSFQDNVNLIGKILMWMWYTINNNVIKMTSNRKKMCIIFLLFKQFKIR